ncbi:hypothetical protein EYF80_021008 [Liparis tanakae]|uniref:Uncharacterized protein n=1 Tax=Liparis tanakae TaxID=230148 RepID=A0A4Z2HT43_9TELE|nr:hypothetical protein EYF80_021008 [Liparis tanakae]
MNVSRCGIVHEEEQQSDSPLAVRWRLSSSATGCLLVEGPAGRPDPDDLAAAPSRGLTGLERRPLRLPAHTHDSRPRKNTSTAVPLQTAVFPPEKPPARPLPTFTDTCRSGVSRQKQ